MGLLAVGFDVPGTGLARVMSRITGEVADTLDVRWIGIGRKEAATDDRGVARLPCNVGGGDLFGARQLREVVATGWPDVVFILNDVWLLDAYRRVLPEIGERVPVVAYCPLDGAITDPGILRPLQNLDRLVLYTRFARREMERAARELRDREPEFALPQVEVIPHGVSTSIFRPLPSGARRAARRELFPPDPGWQEGFVVLNANRPQPRKRVDLTVRGFARFATRAPGDVRLYLHHGVASPDERARVAEVVEGCGLGDRVRLSPSPETAPPVDHRTLNRLYNACDVGVNSSLGEGWGMVSFEHAATGAAQVVPRHSACAELWEGAAELVEPVRSVSLPGVPLEMREIPAEGVGDALLRLHSDPTRLRELGGRGRARARRPGYRWETIGDRWRELFLELTG